MMKSLSGEILELFSVVLSQFSTFSTRDIYITFVINSHMHVYIQTKVEGLGMSI